MQRLLAVAALAAILSAQPTPLKRTTIAPHAHGEISMTVPSPMRGKIIDILTTDPSVRISLTLPDGKVVTADNADDLDFSWELDSPESPSDLHEILTESMITGTGQHTLIGLPESVKGNNFRIGMDASDRGTEVSARWIDLSPAYIEFLRKLPGVPISDPLQIPARSSDSRLQFTLRRAARGSGEAPAIDIVVGSPRVRVSIQFPDGAIATSRNAKELALDWWVTEWPPTSVRGEDPWGGGVIFMLVQMLPLEGTHHFATFTNGIPQSGVYRILLDAVDNARPSRARALYLSPEAIAELRP